MTDRSQDQPRIRVQDRRRARQEGPADGPAHLRPEIREADEGEAAPQGGAGAAAEAAESADERAEADAGADLNERAEAEEQAEASHDYLEDLRRLQAEFENFKKQNLKRQTEIVEQANVRLVERLLPVLDNFERAIEHGEGGAGVELVFKELRGVLESEGLSPIEAQDQPFDPTLHEPIETHVSEDVDSDTIARVYRTGYRFKGRLLRPALVVVAQPPAEQEQEASEG